jgi:hypothetical protein
MAKQESKKVVTKKVAKDPKKVSQSTELVYFKASKNHNGIKKDKVYPLSRNVAEILEMQGLGKQV